MINVGIQENVRLVKAELRPSPDGNKEKDCLVIGLSVGEDGGKINLASLTKAETQVSDGDGQEYYLWPFDNKDAKGAVADVAEVIKRMTGFKARLTEILAGYMSLETIEKKWNDEMFKGTGVNENNGEELLIKADIVNKVYRNLSLGFVDLIQPFVGSDQAPKFRVKLVRQSKAKHFSNIPRFAPFWEDMNVPKDQSKLKFTKWEVDNGMNDGTPAEEPEADKPDPGQAEEIDAVFDVNS